MSEWLSCRPNLEVADLGQASAFLRDVLGFTVDLEEQAVGLVLLSRDAVGLALVRAANPGVNDTTAAYIGVAGVDDLYGHCQRRGATIVTPLTEHPWGLRDFVIEIPGGHRLAFGERIERLLAQPGCPGAGTRELEPGHGRRASSRRYARRLLSARLARNGSDPGVLHCGPFRTCGWRPGTGTPELAPETGPPGSRPTARCSRGSTS